MGIPKLTKEEKKIKISITLSQDLLKKIKKLTNNKSFFIEQILLKEFKNEQ